MALSYRTHSDHPCQEMSFYTVSIKCGACRHTHLVQAMRSWMHLHGQETILASLKLIDAGMTREWLLGGVRVSTPSERGFSGLATIDCMNQMSLKVCLKNLGDESKPAFVLA